MINTDFVSRLPDEFIQRMNQFCDDNWLDGYTNIVHRGLRVNTLKITAEKLLPLISEFHPEPSIFAKEGYSVDATIKVGANPLHHAGAFYMQEPSAMSAVSVLDPKPGEKILDLCAAPGGKSTQIAARLEGKGILWCNEYIRSRAKILLQNIERLGITNSVVSSSDVKPLCSALEGYFDAVLVDAPCSGEGMFRKEPEALAQWSLDNIRLCAERGATILDEAAKAVKPGGRLVFSTCTFAPEENEVQIGSFLLRHPEFSLKPIDISFGKKGFAWNRVQSFADFSLPDTIDLTYTRRIFPADGGEGHFIALFEKSIDAPVYSQKLNSISTQKGAPEKEIAEWFVDIPKGVLAQYGNYWHVIPECVALPQKISILSAGVPVAEICRNRVEPTHAAFMAYGTNAKQVVSFKQDDPRIASFLHGDTIHVDGPNGYTAILVEGVCVGFGKVTNGILKNHYPKGLRTL